MQSNFGMFGFGGAVASLFAFLGIVWALFVTVFWMICGWRAMRAHEKLADFVALMSHKEM